MAFVKDLITTGSAAIGGDLNVSGSINGTTKGNVSSITVVNGNLRITKGDGTYTDIALPSPPAEVQTATMAEIDTAVTNGSSSLDSAVANAKDVYNTIVEDELAWAASATQFNNNIGDLSQLRTSDQTSLVDAINEIAVNSENAELAASTASGMMSSLSDDIGVIGSLNSGIPNRSSLVDAINSVYEGRWTIVSNNSATTATVAVQEKCVYYQYGTLTSLTITSLGNTYSETIIQFTCPESTPTTLVMPANYRYIGAFGNIYKGNTYLISIQGGIAVMGLVMTSTN